MSQLCSFCVPFSVPLIGIKKKQTPKKEREKKKQENAFFQVLAGLLLIECYGKVSPSAKNYIDYHQNLPKQDPNFCNIQNE